MIQLLEQHLRVHWSLLEPATPPPSSVHWLKLGMEEYPEKESALLLLAFPAHGRWPLAVAKVARDPEGNAWLEGEGEQLRRLGHVLPEALARRVPRLLHQGRINDCAFLLMTALPGEVELHNTWGARGAGGRGARLQAALDWALDLAAALPSAPLQPAAWLGTEALAAFWEDAIQVGWDAALRQQLEARLEPHWQTHWPAGCAHGDYFPGNVLFRGRALSGVVDWTLATERAPIFLDVLTYECSFAVQAARRGRLPEWREIRAVHDLAPLRTARLRLQSQGIDIGLGRPERFFTLLALHRTARRAGRRPMGLAFARILQAELAGR